MNGNDVMGLLAAVALVTIPFVGTLLSFRSGRNNEKRRGMNGAEFYAMRQVQKNNTIRQMRAVAREHQRPRSRQRRREWPS